MALTHFAYFPGTALTAAVWGVLPGPLDDYRLFVLLATIGCFLAVLVFDAPIAVRLAVGAALAASPLLVRGAWFGTADAPSLLALVLAFALLTRSRLVWAAAALAAAILLKQFALVARAVLRRDAARAAARPRDAESRGRGVRGGPARRLPAVPRRRPGALWRDTVSYGAGTYRIVGYGLSELLSRGVIDDRYGSYPFGILVLAGVAAGDGVARCGSQRRSGRAWRRRPASRSRCSCCSSSPASSRPRISSGR